MKVGPNGGGVRAERGAPRYTPLPVEFVQEDLEVLVVAAPPNFLSGTSDTRKHRIRERTL